MPRALGLSTGRAFHLLLFLQERNPRFLRDVFRIRQRLLRPDLLRRLASYAIQRSLDKLAVYLYLHLRASKSSLLRESVLTGVSFFYLQDVGHETSLKFPTLYMAGQKKLYFNFKVFWMWMAYALWHGWVIYFFPMLVSPLSSSRFRAFTELLTAKEHRRSSG